DLKQQYTNSIMARFANFSEDFTNIFHGFVNFSYRTNYIGTSTTFNQMLKPVTIADKVILPPGAQLSKPVNLEGFWNATAFLTYGFPLVFMSSNINLNAGGIYTSTPSLVNGESNFLNMFNMNFILVLSSNISENLDFTISSRASLVSTKNSLQSSLDNKYNSYSTAVNLKWTIWSGFFLEADYRNQFYSGLVQDNSAYNLLNFGIGKKFLENNAAEIKLSVFDALQQNKSYTTGVTDYYVEYSQNQVLQQYVMLTFSYNVRKFKMFGPMF
ncbi:MAG: TonB-dependent receptor, partial [Ignavibacteria bacterium]|nr:TonB-dependent receptor [Ignavibacteria bacterium]